MTQDLRVGRPCFSGCSISEIDFAAEIGLRGADSFFPEDADDHGELPNRRVVETRSEHTVEGTLEGCLLASRYGFLSCYDAFSTCRRPASLAFT